jgi:D-glycero-D-manno-heptose 1,7-bisphosphate phosphatase
VFLDRDGTLVRDRRHSADPAALRLLPGVTEALGALSAAGYRLVVATNQAGVARGLFTLAEAGAMALRLAALLESSGVRLNGYYLCPHHPDGAVPELTGGCACRKPQPGLLRRAAAQLHLDLARSWLVGDALTDIGAAAAVGVRSVLVDIGTESCPAGMSPPSPTYLARSLPHAAALILAADQGLANPLAPRPVALLDRPAPPPDGRTTGMPCARPDPAWLAQAAQDAAMLEAILRPPAPAIQ